MDQCVVLVDAGYLLASAAHFVTGSSQRAAVTVDHEGLIGELRSLAEAVSDRPCLRVSWYDAATDAKPTYQQRLIGLLPGVKLRLGRVSPQGEQKGVDVRLAMDLLALASHHRVDVVVLVSGDDDLTEAVEEAQAAGVKVIVVGVPAGADSADAVAGVSHHLKLAADQVVPLDATALRTHVTVNSAAAQPGTALRSGTSRAARTPGPEPAARDMPVTGPATGVDPVPLSPTPSPDDSSTMRDAEPLRDDGITQAHEAPEGHDGTSEADDVEQAVTTPSSPEAVSETEGSPAGTASSGAADPSNASDAPGVGTAPRPGPGMRPGLPPTRTSVPQPVYSTTTGEEPVVTGRPEADPQGFSEVCAQALRVWKMTKEPHLRAAELAGRPVIPRDLDGALLHDASVRLGVYVLTDGERITLRDVFWRTVDRDPDLCGDGAA